jgi:hypothetical protein
MSCAQGPERLRTAALRDSRACPVAQVKVIKLNVAIQMFTTDMKRFCSLQKRAGWCFVSDGGRSL